MFFVNLDPISKQLEQQRSAHIDLHLKVSELRHDFEVHRNNYRERILADDSRSRLSDLNMLTSELKQELYKQKQINDLLLKHIGLEVARVEPGWQLVARKET